MASDRLQNFPTETSKDILLELAASSSAIDELLKELCGKAIGQDQIDGLRILLENNEIAHFRPSGNAPELRCYAESASQERSDMLVRECLRRMNSRSSLRHLPKDEK